MSGPQTEFTRALLRFNAHVLGVLLAILGSAGLFPATLIMWLQGNDNPDSLLALLRHLLPGYKVTPAGGFVGALWAAVIGYGVGAVFGLAYGPWLLRDTSRPKSGARVDQAAIDPDVVVLVDRNKDVGVFWLGFGYRGIGTVYVQASLLDEGGGNDEEDEHDEHDVEHRRQVNLIFFLFLDL